MSNNTAQFEMFRDPFKMLAMLIQLVSEQLGIELDYKNIPAYENDTFLIRSVRLDDLNNQRYPNFIYKKNQTEISWYQYLGRDIYCNKDLTRDEYNKMFVECMASLYDLD
ncbi:hypothetical protein M5X11_12510 [Paenibacillus alginolyticus]|uniref:hypothetical protein n=1 Tax=Paenibacillus alginolyticus TaxID=59839 RepID=UPI000410FA93|nr:hypothetical protein [Paenibacillus alginolyticus]MCY9665778.1 hypothetical protein [Paenibacillus alginolyticus]